MKRRTAPCCVWIVTDQHKNVTGKVYQAFVAALRSGRGEVRIRVVPVPQGKFRSKRKDTEDQLVATLWPRLAKQPRRRHAMLVLVDSEDMQPGHIKRSRQHLLTAARRAGARLGMDERHVHAALVPPMTEALYLVDATILKAALAGGTPGKDPTDLGRRRARGELIQKKDVEEAFQGTRVLKDKEGTSGRVVKAIEGWQAVPRNLLGMPCIQELQAWVLGL